ncbi:MAG: RES family NAD+ phosphorylase [Rhodobacteraceae bacterium]|nr:RES family NAD+ phosphorylase [Paracoccaceae bacterium]
MAGAGPLTRIDAVFYRMKFAHEAADILAPARSAEGRSHYGTQRALYLSASAKGTVIASRRYFAPGDPPRAIFPLHVTADRIVDLRDPSATRHFGIDTTHRTAEWQESRARGEPAPTWAISDRVRALGLQGMLYASRSDPAGTTHLTLFRWNEPGGAIVSPAGSAMPY